MRYWFIGAAVLLLLNPFAYSQESHTDECVILLHGLGRTAGSMSAIEDALHDHHYDVWNGDYPSTDLPIETLAPQTIDKGVAYCLLNQAQKIHFITHSMGGILVRQYLQDHVVSELGDIIMLAPPNQGSEIADMLQHYYVYRKAMGPAGQQLITGESGLTASLAPIPGVIGIIIGNDSSDPWFSPYIPGQDDGKVSLESARLDEMADFLVVDAGHTFVMNDYIVIQQILYFLGHGQFAEFIEPEPSWFDSVIKAFSTE